MPARVCLLVGALVVGLGGCHLLLPMSDRTADGSAGDAQVTGAGFRPSNITPRSPVPPACHSVVFGSTLYTDDCVVGGCAGEKVPQVAPALSPAALCVLSVGRLVVPRGTTVTVIGSHSLAIHARTEVLVDGIIDAGARGIDGGPGGGRGGRLIQWGPTNGAGEPGQGPGGGQHCNCDVTKANDCGGGGGGHDQGGAAGGDEILASAPPCGPSPGGNAYGSDDLIPLTAGSGGSAGHNASQDLTSSPPGRGGGGGGAVQLSASQRIVLSGGIRAVGAGGAGGIGAGGGGGAGGSVMLEAAAIEGAGWISVAGGGGGGGGTGSSVSSPVAGQDGRDGLEQGHAAGGQGALSAPERGDGGAGGSGASSPTDGQAASRGGGGGGGAGRIRINSSAGSTSLGCNGKLSTGKLQPL